MWRYPATEDEAVIEFYKHGITRRHPILAQRNHAHRNGRRHRLQIPVAVALDRVLPGLVGRGDTIRAAEETRRPARAAAHDALRVLAG